MPLVHIHLRKGKPREHVRAIADGVHRALGETFGVPADDRFQFVHQYEPDEAIVDPHYFGIERGGDAVFIEIVASDWRDTAAKKALFARIAALLAERPGLRPEDVQIVLAPNKREDWSFGLGRASYVTD